MENKVKNIDPKYLRVQYDNHNKIFGMMKTDLNWLRNSLAKNRIEP